MLKAGRRRFGARMPLAALFPLALLLLGFSPETTPAPQPAASHLSVVAPTGTLSASWDADVLVLSGLARGARIRVYDVVGHVLAEFRSESPEARLQLRQRQLVAVCAGGECVGAR